MRAAWGLIILAFCTPAFGQDRIDVPSGQSITLQDVVLDAPGPMGLTARFHFLAPQIARAGGTIDFETASADMDHLCNSFALPRIGTVTGPAPQQIVIALSDIPVAFGESMPEATQFFEAYAIDGANCVWEAF